MKLLLFILPMLLHGGVLCASDWQVEFLSVDQEQDLSEDRYQILKNETKINELYDEINELKVQLNKLDLMHTQTMYKLNSLLPKEDQAVSYRTEENEEEFKYGFDMLTAGNYERAYRAFKLFIEKYPNDPKIGEAYFWLGEVSYKTKDYKQAAKSYLVAYRDYKNNSRRNDSLFKLSVVLGYLGQKSEACAGFDILVNDIPSVTKNLRQKSINESVNFSCKN